jgi:hypothetical protein
MGVRAQHKMRNSKSAKEGIQPFIFSSPIQLDSNNFAIKHPFNKALKFFKKLEDFGFPLKKINPREFTIVIYKTGIISFFDQKNLWPDPTHRRR